MYPNDIFRLIIRYYSVPDEVGMIATPLKRRVIAHVDELDPDRVTVNGYQPLLRTPLILMIVVIGHVRQLVELPATRRLILLLIVVVRGRLRDLFLFMRILLLLLCSLMIWDNCTHVYFRDMFQRGGWLLLF